MSTVKIEEMKSFKFTCLKCSYTWMPRTGRPVLCPRCHQRIKYEGEE